MKSKRPCSGCGKLLAVGGASRQQPTCQPCRRKAHATVCPTCGVEFRRPYTATYCSRECSGNRAGLDHSPRACEQCGEIFTPRDHGADYLQRLCSYKCKNEAARRRWPSSRIYVKTCDECGKLFVAQAANRKRCSDECARLYNNRSITESIKARYHSDPAFRDLVISRAQNRRASLLGSAKITSPKALVTYLLERDRARCQIPDCKHSTRRITATTGPWRPSIDHITPLSRGGAHELANVQLAHYQCNLAKNAYGGGEQLLLVG